MARANSAHERQDGHEELCAQRYASIAEALAELKGDAKGQRALLWGIILSVAGAVTMALMAIVLHAVKLT